MDDTWDCDGARLSELIEKLMMIEAEWGDLELMVGDYDPLETLTILIDERDRTNPDDVEPKNDSPVRVLGFNLRD